MEQSLLFLTVYSLPVFYILLKVTNTKFQLDTIKTKKSYKSVNYLQEDFSPGIRCQAEVWQARLVACGIHLGFGLGFEAECTVLAWHGAGSAVRLVCDGSSLMVE